jgi:2-oxoglutarate ferredoxin oxidoreductase subunit gamma
MQTEIIISGFGGQGVLFAGQLLAYSALDQDLHVTWIPSYGPEMRGGTAHCTVIISDDEIGSPLVRDPRAAIVMNLPSLDRYESLVKPGGVLVVNASLVDRQPTRQDVTTVMIHATEEAEAIGDRRMGNLVLLGALLELLPVLPPEAVGDSLGRHIPAHHRDLLKSNLEAMARGAALATAARRDAVEPEAVSPGAA